MNARKQRDYYAGALMTLVGVGAAFQATRYDLGTLTSMGTGAFPLGLSILLALLGIAIVFTAGQGGAESRDWAGGYGSFQRQALRLAHIAAFALGIINVLYGSTTRALDLLRPSPASSSRPWVIAETPGRVRSSSPSA